MLSRKCWSLFLVALLLTLTASGQSAAPQSVQRDPQAVAALAGALTALGGSAQPLPASIAGSGTYTRLLAGSPVSYPFRVKVMGFDNFRWEVDTPDQGTVVTIVSGTASWRQTAQGTDAISVGEIPGNTFESFPALALAQWAASSSVGVTLVGLETIAGRSVQHVSIAPTLPPGTDPLRANIYATTHQREVFLDPKTFMPVRLRYYRHSRDWRVATPVDVEYSNFQLMSGIAFPLTITTYTGGQPSTQFQYQSLTMNAPVSASDFAGGAQ